MNDQSQAVASKAYTLLSLGLVLPFAATVVLDWVWVRFGEPLAVEVFLGLSGVTILVLTPLVVFEALARAHNSLGIVGRVLLTALASLFWYFIAVTVFMNLHMAFGGPH